MSGDRSVSVRIFANIETLGRAAADRFAELADRSISMRGIFSAALSGGSSPKQLYDFLGSSLYRDAVQWSKVHLFWADERCVPPDHPDSNYKLAAETFLSRVSLPTENIHRVKGEEGPDKAARSYEEGLRRFFPGHGIPAFDLILLGAGEDGHTASLFPGSSSLRETERLAVPVYPEHSKRDRVTLTLPVLNHATHVIFLVSGFAKAEIVSAILEGKDALDYPAGLVRSVDGEVVWFLDSQAAGKLKRPVHT